MAMIRYRMGQWVLEVEKKDEAGDELVTYRFFNPDADGVELYYAVVPGKYGQPLIEAEPAFRIDCPAGLSYVNNQGDSVEPDQKIAGLICKDGPRFSLSNAIKQLIEIRVNEDGSILVDGEVWWISTLLLKDKNRIVGYDAYMISTEPASVCVLELGDLDLF